jgi:hypothetical protein
VVQFFCLSALYLISCTWVGFAALLRKSGPKIDDMNGYP